MSDEECYFQEKRKQDRARGKQARDDTQLSDESNSGRDVRGKSERSNGKAKEKRGGKDREKVGEELIVEFLEADVERLKKKKEALKAYVDRPDPEGACTLGVQRPVLMLQKNFEADQAPPVSKRKVVMILDRENNCTQFLEGVFKLPKWLELYVVWNPKSLNAIALNPAVKKASCLIEAEHNVLKACTFLAGTIAREHLSEARDTDIYLIYNRTHANESLRRYGEVEAILSSVSYNVEARNGAGCNFANFLEHREEDYSRYSKEGPKGCPF